ncbi:hypothetical protein ALC62_10594 [Cyphomyrmex costatus]|uniref:Uncharacterized protein n=1 Tax=Cyphomyrmex costatus TaxID=456900 RepID=A0A195CEH6_9HYME|nr:hypothetical protein ALC62_10594 [Cyphomyrmex costatus]
MRLASAYFCNRSPSPYRRKSMRNGPQWNTSRYYKSYIPRVQELPSSIPLLSATLSSICLSKKSATVISPAYTARCILVTLCSLKLP